MPVDTFVIRSNLQLQLAVRLDGFLRLEKICLLVPQTMVDSRIVTSLINEEWLRTDAGMQLFSWQLEQSLGPFNNRYILSSRFYDRGMDRMFVRMHVYDAALALCMNGKPALQDVVHTAMRAIPYGRNAPNPHCVSGALRAHNGVCQAIAVYMCQLLLRCGYPAVVRVGQMNGSPHAWNHVYVNGAWRRLDLCVPGPAALFARYHDLSPTTPDEQYRRMGANPERKIELYSGGATLNGMRLPFFIADRNHVCPTRFVQCFNGAYKRKEDQLFLAFGNTIRKVPLSRLSVNSCGFPLMEIHAFADLFELPLTNGCLCFQETL